MRFVHTADLHLGKTYRNSPGETERYKDFFACLAALVTDAVRQQVDFFVIVGDLFHIGQILPRTFARTIETLQPLKDNAIPCIAVEGNHDWIHRRDSISWMEALAEMGYIRLLRPSRTENGGYHFDPLDESTGIGGYLEIKGFHIYGLGYIGAQAGNHVPRICEAVTTDNNLLLFHVGIWNYSPVEIGNMRLKEAHPLAETFAYVALGHGHKPYVINTPEGKPYAYNPGSPERVNFGEERYDKGYYLVDLGVGEEPTVKFITTSPRPMLTGTIGLDGVGNASEALEIFRKQVGVLLAASNEEQRPLMELRLTGRVGFHPFELGREQLRAELQEMAAPLHVEIKNHLSLVTRSGDRETAKKSLLEIEKEVLAELIGSGSGYRERKAELVGLALVMRDLVLQKEVEDEDLLDLLEGLEK
ncbi:MAG: exonuclease SbcCD subunit D [Deltaproteobacteria bacterium]|nr:exonuclease SbcCD subunit D [Deltaproteobacteria bacterium]